MGKKKESTQLDNEYTLGNVEIELFRAVINVICADTCKNALERAAKNSDGLTESIHQLMMDGIYDLQDHDRGFFVKTDTHNIILIADHAEIDTVVHECFHATTAIMNSKSMRLTPDSEEAYAYVMGSLTQEVINIWNKHKGYALH